MTTWFYPGQEDYITKLNELGAIAELLSGPKGWSPAFAVVSDGSRRVLQIVDWVGGEGTKPATGGYIGSTGIVGTAAQAIDIRGPQGATGNTGPANSLSIGTVTSGASASATISGTAPTQQLSLVLPKGDKGFDGWNPTLSVVTDGGRRVLRIVDWVGGEGTKPATGGYIGATGIVATAALAVDIRGSTGAAGSIGATGPSNTLAIGTVTSAVSPSATITGASPNQTLNLVLPKGDKGDTGNTGPANTLTIGTVTTGAASATITGTAPAQVLNLVLPKGDKGDKGDAGTNGTDGTDGAAATITVGTVTTGAPGTSVIVSNSGTSSAAVLDFTIPRGDTGAGGGGGSEDTTTSFTYTYTGVMGMPPAPLPGSGTILASPAGNERAFNVLFVGAANPELTSIEFTKLEFVGGTFSPTRLASLTSLSMPALTKVGGDFTPTTMISLTNLSLPALAMVGGSFNPSAMAALTSLSLPALTTVGGAFNPFNMAALTSLTLPALAIVGGNFSLSNMAAFTSLSMPALTTVGGSFHPSAMTALTSLSMPALTTVAGLFSLSNMALTSLSMPAIKQIGTTVTTGNAIQISSGMGALTTFTLPATLKQVGSGAVGHVTITSAALNQASVDSILVRLAALDGTGGTAAFSNRTVTITGTSAAPSSTGLVAKATLVSRGCTVTHN